MARQSTAPGVSAPPAGGLMAESPGRVLVVDDDYRVRQAMVRVLELLGHEAVPASGGAEALEYIAKVELDVVLTDISMPGMDGIRLLREIRSRDSYVQVILMTGVPSIETAISALDYGAMKYLTKPIDLDEVRLSMDRAVRHARMARIESRAAALAGNAKTQAADLAGLEVSFERTLRSLWVAYQPMLDASSGAVMGYEALVRSKEAALPDPLTLIDAAERLGRLNQLGRLIREHCVRPFADGEGPLLFVNLHPEDLLDPMLGAPGTRLRELASRVVLEITERASLHKIPDAASRVISLREAGFRIAVDDLGAGYAGLSSFTHLEPDFVKLDVSLVRDVDRKDTKRRVVGAITHLAKELGMTVVAEGIETVGESETLRSLGCDFLQGFLFAPPGPAFPEVHWPEPQVSQAPQSGGTDDSALSGERPAERKHG